MCIRDSGDGIAGIALGQRFARHQVSQPGRRLADDTIVAGAGVGATEGGVGDEFGPAVAGHVGYGDDCRGQELVDVAAGRGVVTEDNPVAIDDPQVDVYKRQSSRTAAR